MSLLDKPRILIDDRAGSALSRTFELKSGALPLLDFQLPGPPERTRVLVVPTREMNGDLIQKLMEHFDQLAGREIANRPVAADDVPGEGELNNHWIRKYLLGPHCMIYHGAGIQHDFSTHAGVVSKLRKSQPQSSPM